MFGANDNKPMLPISMEGVRLPYNDSVVPSMQLDAMLFGCNADMMNVVGGKHTPTALPLEKLERGTSNFGPQKFSLTSSYGEFRQNDVGQVRNVMKQIPVSTGLKLSYGEEEPISSISSAGETIMNNLSPILSHSDCVQSEFARQSDEFHQYIRIQEENFRKGIIELNHRHTLSLLNALEKEVSHKMHEKDVAIHNLSQRNKELTDNIRQIALEAQSWHLKAKQNESLVNILRNNINQVFLQGAAVLKEGCGENLTDDASSSCNVIDPCFQQNTPLTKGLVFCKACLSKEVSVLMLPCRHLCLCTDCDIFIDICPICREKKAESLHVYVR